MRTAILVAALGVGCTIGELDEDEETDFADEETDSEFDGRRAAYSATGTPSPSKNFNFNGRHNDQCVRLERVTALRYPDGRETGYVLDPAKLKFNPARRTVDDSSGRPCEDGEIQLDTQEILTADGKRLLFHRGGFPYSPAGDVKYGHVHIGDLAEHADVGKNQANGIECYKSKSSATKGSYRIVPTSIPKTMTFRKSNYKDCVADARREGTPLSACTNGYQSYGNPGYDQGNFPEAARRSYTYLLWNFTNVRGGGVVRALMPPEQPFHRCNVRAIKQTAYNADGTREIGWVKAIYGKTRFAGKWLYGWVVHSHACTSEADCGPEGTVFHVKGL